MWEGSAVTAQALLLTGSSLPFSTGHNSCSGEVATLPSRSSVFGDARETRKREGRTEWTLFFPSSCKVNKNAFLWFCFFWDLCPKSLPNYHSLGKSQLQSCFQKHFCFVLLPRSSDQSVIIYSTFVFLDNDGYRKVWTKPECLLHETRQQG